MMRGKEGFTLLEVMAALAILAAGLGIVLGSFSMQLRAAKRARDMSQAVYLAQQMLAEVRSGNVTPWQDESDELLSGESPDRGWGQEVEIRDDGAVAGQAWGAFDEEGYESFEWRLDAEPVFLEDLRVLEKEFGEPTDLPRPELATKERVPELYLVTVRISRVSGASGEPEEMVSLTTYVRAS